MTRLVEFTRRAPIPTYRVGEMNRCGACGSRAWRVGRVTAECGQCDNVLALDGIAEGDELATFHYADRIPPALIDRTARELGLSRMSAYRHCQSVAAMKRIQRQGR